MERFERSRNDKRVSSWENMKRGMKTFARAIRDGKTDKAEEMLENIVQGNMKVNIWRGYRRALEGAVEALDSDEELTLPRQMAEDKFSLEKLETIQEEMESKSSQEFRSESERGFNSAWADILQVIVEDAKS